MDGAELYLLLLRPVTRLPVIGEAVRSEFTGQIEIGNWSWDMKNRDEATREKRRQRGNRGAAGAADKADKLAQEMVTLLRDNRNFAGMTETKKKSVLLEFFSDGSRRWPTNAETLKGQTPGSPGNAPARGNPAAAAVLGGQDDDEDDEQFSFSFSKRVDLASTQLLTSMMLGDVFPSGTLTVHQRSANSGLSLVFNIQGLQLTDYRVRVEQDDTMTDLTEEWTATYRSLGYVYKNRNIIDKTDMSTAEGASQGAAKAATQGTVREFVMQNIKLPF